MAAESRTNPILKGSYDLENRIWQVLYQLKEIDSPSRKDFYKIGALKAMGLARISDFFPAIEQFLEDPNPDVVKQAILSAGDSLDNYFIPGLIQYMAFPDFASEARRSLIKYGKEHIAPLSDYIQDDKSQPEIIQQITLIAQNFGTQPP
ncbi:MAG: HEAT repeat domain-containing protein [Bacteroidia bacterium]